VKTPFILVNFKTYPTAVGAEAVKLAKIHEQVAQETGANIGIAVGALDLKEVAAAVSIPVFAQHVDGADFGSFTGQIVPEQVRSLGAVGTLLNHSERRIGSALPAAVAAAKAAGLKIVLCAESTDEAEELAQLAPDFLAVEPPQLIGGDVSVTTANPEVIGETLAVVGTTPLLVGAGVKNATDVQTALKLGAVGVLLASGVTKAEDPAAVLRELTNGLK
jgi:triosephosphate isomerase